MSRVMRSIGILYFCCTWVMLAGGATPLAPCVYRQAGDTPASFHDARATLAIENFEDNSLEPFLDIDHGRVLQPDGGQAHPVTDSVDRDVVRSMVVAVSAGDLVPGRPGDTCLGGFRRRG